MGRIFKSQVYQLTRDKLFYVVLIVCIVFSVVEAMQGGAQEVYGPTTTGSEFYANPGLYGGLVVLVFVMIMIQLRDISDKTINYDIMTGNSRRKVFFARYLSGVVAGGLIYVVLGYGVVMYGTLINGWGDDILPLAALSRMVMSLCVLFRMSAEITLVSVFLRKMVPTMVLCFATGIAEMSLSFLPRGLLCLFSMSSFEEVLFQSGGNQFAADGSVIETIEEFLPLRYAASHVIVALVLGVVCLFVACRIFCRRDFD